MLTLYFTVPDVGAGRAARLPAAVEVFDPTYYVAFEFVETDPVTLDGAPAGCKFEVTRPPEMDAATAELLSGIGPEQRELPPDLQVLTVDQVNGVTLACP